jgi:hypothetical protein
MILLKLEMLDKTDKSFVLNVHDVSESRAATLGNFIRRTLLTQGSGTAMVALGVFDRNDNACHGLHDTCDDIVETVMEMYGNLLKVVWKPVSNVLTQKTYTPVNGKIVVDDQVGEPVTICSTIGAGLPRIVVWLVEDSGSHSEADNRIIREDARIKGAFAVPSNHGDKLKCTFEYPKEKYGNVTLVVKCSDETGNTAETVRKLLLAELQLVAEIIQTLT